jgi:bifunctional non-homologous end joining protein LigD
MECLPVEKIPEGDNWTYELKLDGYRLQAVKAGGKVILYSRRGIDLAKRFEYVAKAVASLPDDTVIELVALDEEGRPNFNSLQNFRSAESHIVFYAFDILIHKGHDLKQLPLSKRRAILAMAIEPSDHVGLSYVSDRPFVCLRWDRGADGQLRDRTGFKE